MTDPGVDIRGDRPSVHLRRHRRCHPGRLDDHRAVRQERAAGARTTARSSRSCARPRSRTTSRASGASRKILTEYLNSIYFGNGANGVESAARVYFGKVHGYDSQAARRRSRDVATARRRSTSPKCAKVLTPWEAALLAGMVANPSAFNPFAHPQAALGRRNLVLKDMRDQGYIRRSSSTTTARAQPLPSVNDLQQPAEPPAAPYFTSWLRPQILARGGAAPGSHAPAAAERRVPRLLRRSQDPDHAGSPAPAGG